MSLISHFLHFSVSYSPSLIWEVLHSTASCQPITSAHLRRPHPSATPTNSGHSSKGAGWANSLFCHGKLLKILLNLISHFKQENNIYTNSCTVSNRKLHFISDVSDKHSQMIYNDDSQGRRQGFPNERANGLLVFL